MTCPACTEAERNPRTGMYQAHCKGCEARSLAVSPAAWRAMQGITSVELRDAILTTWPGQDYEIGRQAVWGWIKRMRDAIKAGGGSLS